MISAVINTLNAESTIERALASVQPWVSEIIVVDMHSSDRTAEICRRYTDKIFFCQKTGYVEPARNFAIAQAAGPFVFVIDADEEAPPRLMERLRAGAAAGDFCDFARVPMRTNFLGRWMSNAAFWPDYHIRFFRKGKVTWQDQIHSFPVTSGKELVIDAEEDLAIRHFFCDHISDFLRRVDPYTEREAESLLKHNPRLPWNGLLRAPVKEFCKRFFRFGAYRDGVHGLIYSLLTAFYGFLSYAKAFETLRQKTPAAEAADEQMFFAGAVRELHKCFAHCIAAIARQRAGAAPARTFEKAKLKVVYWCTSLLKK
jgi:glycosyltransferase involved in cell wall biosynthesis